MDIGSLSPAERQDLLTHSYLDKKFFARTFLGERFRRPFDKLHEEILRAADSGHRKIAIAAPRGIGKTSLMNYMYSLHSILFQSHRYIVPVSCTSTLAEMQSENLKRGLTQNRLVKHFFGDCKSDIFNKEQWVAKVGDREICVMPRGAGQQIRGLLFGDYRPDLFIVDDLEDAESVSSVEQREKLWDWFLSDLMGAIDQSDKNTKIIYVGTVLHEASLLMKLLKDPSWYSITLELCDDDYVSNAPNYMSDEDCKLLAEDYRSKGKIDVFFREFRNKPINKETAVFKQEYFKYYEEKDLNLTRDNRIVNVVLYDPAKTTRSTSDDTAIVGVGLDKYNHCFYFRDCIAGKLHPEQAYEEIAQMCRRLGARYVGVEVTGLNEFITYPLVNYLRKNNVFVEVVELHAKGGRDEKGKVSRVRGLAPFYRMGQIFHNQSVSAKLEGQLLSFPVSQYWDVMDCFAYAIQMFDIGEQFMSPSDAEYRVEGVENEFDDVYDDEFERELNFRII